MYGPLRSPTYVQIRPVRVRVNFLSSTGTGVSSVCTALEVSTTSFMRSHTGLTSSAQAAIQSQHGLPRQLHSVALENRLHAVQRKMISIFAHRHVRQQTRPWQPLL